VALFKGTVEQLAKIDEEKGKSSDCRLYVLFLNKRDLFEQKIESGIDLRDYFEEFGGVAGDSRAAAAFIKDLFIVGLPADVAARVVCHYSVAVDTKNTKIVFDDVVNSDILYRFANS